MESLERTFFEDPTAVYVVLGLLGLILVGVWYGQRTAKWLLALVVLAALGGGVYLLERAVVTDRELIWAAYDDIARSVARHEIERAATYLDGNYRGWGGLKVAAVLAATTAVKAYNIRDVRYMGRRTVELQGSQAHSKVVTVILYGPDGRPPSRTVLGWDVQWVKRDDGWKVRRATLSDDVLPG